MATNESLARHKLLATDEGNIPPGAEVTPLVLAQRVEELLTREPMFAALIRGSAERKQLALCLTGLPLSERMVLKLSSIGLERPELLDHGLRAAVCAAALAQRLNLAQHEVMDALAAGLFHDLGLLHVDPALLQSGKKLTTHERHHLDAHPLAGYRMLEEEPTWHPTVSTAVLEHHERIDGSGYPRGLHAPRLGALGQLLAVAELAATMLVAGGGALSWLRLGVVLRLNAKKLNHEYCATLLEAFPRLGKILPHRIDLGRVIDALVNLAVAFDSWKALRAAQGEAPTIAFIDARMDRLVRNLADAGIDLEYWQEFDADVEQDAQVLSEIEIAAHEGLWQLHAIVEEVRRRGEKQPPGSSGLLAWIESIEAMPR